MFRVLLLKEFRNLIRNRMLLVMICMYPIMILLVLPWATNMDISDLQTLVIDYDKSTTSHQLQEKIYHSGYFIPSTLDFTSHEEAVSSLRKGELDVIITIPHGLEKKITNERNASIHLAVNAVNATKGALGTKYLNSITLQFSDHWQQSRQGQPSFAVTLNEVALYNPTSNYKSFIIPGLIAILITLVAFVLPALNMVEEKEFGTIEQLNVSPLSPIFLILTKTLPFILINLAMMAMALGIIYFAYSIYPVSNIYPLLIATFVYSTALSGLGITIANYSTSQQQAMFGAIFIIFFMLLMSGVFTPISGMPVWAQRIASFEPLTYFVRILRTIYLKGSTPSLYLKDLGYLLGFASLFYFLSWVTYKKKS